MRVSGWVWRAVAAMALGAASQGLMGCGGFFVYPGSTTTATGSSTSDYAYVSNSSSGSTYINGYALSSGSLVAATSSPYSLSFVPSSMVISQNNEYLYVSSQAAPYGIYGYSIGTGGALTILNGSSALVGSEYAVSMDVSPDGQWLFALDYLGTSMLEYSIASSTGLLTFKSSYPLTANATGASVPLAVKVAPSGDFIAVALGTGGVDVFAFNTSTGVAAGTYTTQISTGNSLSSFYDIAIDANNYLYVSGLLASGSNLAPGLLVFSTTAAGVSTAVSTTAYSTGTAPYSIVVSKSGSYVYTGNETASTISGFSIGSSGVLTSTGAALPAPTSVGAMGRDNSGSYILAAGYSATSGLQLFSINSSTGALTESSNAPNGTVTTGVPIVMALTH